jgi:hypothetical protein
MFEPVLFNNEDKGVNRSNVDEERIFKNRNPIERFAFVKPGMKVIWQVYMEQQKYIATYEGKIDDVLLDETQSWITVLDCHSPNPKRVSLEDPSLKFF